MKSRKTKIVKELDPQEITGFSPARVEHYLSLGYKPYLDENSEVKWLTDASRNMRDAKNGHSSLISRIAYRNAYKKHRRKMSKGAFRAFIGAFWPFILILTGIILVLLLLFLRPGILI